MMLYSGMLKMEEMNQMQEPLAHTSMLSQALKTFDKGFDDSKHLSCMQFAKPPDLLSLNCQLPIGLEPDITAMLPKTSILQLCKPDGNTRGNRNSIGETDPEPKGKSVLIPLLEPPKKLKRAQTKKRARKRSSGMSQAGKKRMKKSSAITDSGRWTKEEDEMLKKAVESIGAKNWKLISQKYLNGSRSDVQCLHRWQKVLKPGLVKGPWTKTEDETILRAIKSGMTKWSEIANQIPGRIGKQCRERWFNHLDPSIKKSGWTPEEDQILLEHQLRLGNRWCEIAKSLPGRSENSVKNRWNSAMRKRSMKKLQAAKLLPGKKAKKPAKQKKAKEEPASGITKSRKKSTSGKGVRKNSVIQAREKMESYDVKVPGPEKKEPNEYTELLQYKIFKSRLEARQEFANLPFSGADRRRAHNQAIELLTKMREDDNKRKSPLDIEVFWKTLAKEFKVNTPPPPKQQVKQGKENTKGSKRQQSSPAKKQKPASSKKVPKKNTTSKQTKPLPTKPPAMKSRESLKIDVSTPLLPIWNLPVSPAINETAMNSYFGLQGAQSPLRALVNTKEQSPEVDENVLLTADLLENDNPISFQLL